MLVYEADLLMCSDEMMLLRKSLKEVFYPQMHLHRDGGTIQICSWSVAVREQVLYIYQLMDSCERFNVSRLASENRLVQSDVK